MQVFYRKRRACRCPPPTIGLSRIAVGHKAAEKAGMVQSKRCFEALRLIATEDRHRTGGSNKEIGMLNESPGQTQGQRSGMRGSYICTEEFGLLFPTYQRCAVAGATLHILQQGL